MADTDVREPSGGPAGTNHVSVRAGAARTKHVTLPLRGDEVAMGMHGDVAAHYKVPEGSYEPAPTTIDYFVAAAVACLCGTFGGMLERSGQPIGHGELVADGEGELHNDGGTLRVRRILVAYRLDLADGVDAEAAARAHERHVDFCPIAQTIGECVAISTTLTFA